MLLLALLQNKKVLAIASTFRSDLQKQELITTPGYGCYGTKLGHHDLARQCVPYRPYRT